MTDTTKQLRQLNPGDLFTLADCPLRHQTPYIVTDHTILQWAVESQITYVNIENGKYCTFDPSTEIIEIKRETLFKDTTTLVYSQADKLLKHLLHPAVFSDISPKHLTEIEARLRKEFNLLSKGFLVDMFK